MLIKTLLNYCYHFKSFVYGKCTFDRSQAKLTVEIKARKNAKPLCPHCNRSCPQYDKQKKRLFEFIPFWGIRVFFSYRPRRVECPEHGVVVEAMPWAQGKCHSTIPHMLFLAEWARVLSWKEVSRRFKTSWRKVCEAVTYVVQWGLQHRDMTNITAIGVDEISICKGHKYLTLVYQINEHCKRLLWVGENRDSRTMIRFFYDFGVQRRKLIKYVCSDMWKPYLKVIKKRIPQAVHILDRFHIMQKINKAIDEVRATEARELKSDGQEPVLKKSRWCLLKRKENLTEKQEKKLKDLLRYNIKSVRAYLLKEDFQGLWDYVSPAWAGKFIDRWTKRVMYSRIDPMKKIAKMVRKHKPLILNWFKAKGAVSTGVVEGMNNRTKVTVKKSYGFRTFKIMQISLYHELGKLPVPELTHRLW